MALARIDEQQYKREQGYVDLRTPDSWSYVMVHVMHIEEDPSQQRSQILADWYFVWTGKSTEFLRCVQASLGATQSGIWDCDTYAALVRALPHRPYQERGVAYLDYMDAWQMFQESPILRRQISAAIGFPESAFSRTPIATGPRSVVYVYTNFLAYEAPPDARCESIGITPAQFAPESDEPEGVHSGQPEQSSPWPMLGAITAAFTIGIALYHDWRK